MKFTLHCNLCLEVSKINLVDEHEELDAREELDYMIHGMIEFRRYKETQLITCLCSKCIKKLQRVIGFNQFRNKMEDEVVKLRKELSDCHAIMQGNQQGLNNVYREFSKLTDEGFITGFNQKMNEYREEFNKIRKEVDKNESFVKAGLKKIGTINDLYRLSKYEPKKIQKLSKIVDILSDDEEEDDF